MSYQKSTALTNRSAGSNTQDDSLQLVPDSIANASGSNRPSLVPRWSWKSCVVGLVATVGAALLVVGVGSRNHASLHVTTNLLKVNTNKKLDATSTTANDSPTKHNIPIPSGVNFGSWLSLEDYFYAGPTGAVEVASPDHAKVGICLPPLHVGQEGAPAWQAETDLLGNLVHQVGMAQAIKIFHAHRTSFVTEYDFQRLAQLGVKHVRVPLSWCFTDARPDDINTTDTSTAYSKLLQERFTCKDPFYGEKEVNAQWPAIPRSLIIQLLRLCAKYDITASLDLHTYPGATSPGTFSGLWPRAPRFWHHDNPQSEGGGDVGRQLLRDFIQWMEAMARDDPVAFSGLRGISPMNEPAHLAGLFRHTERDYLPPLPQQQADAYLEELNGQGDVYIPDGPHLRVLLWLRDATEIFRSSQLPGLGKQLHLNVHESFLSPEAVRKDILDEKDGKQRHDLIASWWSKTTSYKERKSWAVLDMHHYHAWDQGCTGASDGPPVGNYTCSNVDARTKTLARCTEWAAMFRKVVTKHCGEGTQLMSGEFSASTHHKVRHACNDIDSLQATYTAQMEAAQASAVEMYYWSYKMPFGGAFKSAWSFSQLMYLLGASDRPDESAYNCGEHISHPLEVTDDIFGK